ncbi:MAG TPA: hypothetical protein VEA59_03575 [Patescibacteria group bacterium]|nr:hypothetical protein [Patescibacteria group bacterium]
MIKVICYMGIAIAKLAILCGWPHDYSKGRFQKAKGIPGQVYVPPKRY